MTTSPPPSSSHVGRFTGLVLVMAVCVCVCLIGFSGYLKYQLDRAEASLYAPETYVSADQETTEKMRRSLDYSGFVGLAQNYVTARDAGTLNDMKAHLKTANDLVINLPERTPTDVRQNLQAIINTFDVVMQKAIKSSTDAATSFTMNDLLPLYGALPVLNSNLDKAAASNRIEAHNHLQFWAMLLTLISWSSLIIAAAMSVGIYLSLRDRNSAPLRALAQSIKNMSSGDMRTSIWGMERTDMIGELARSADLARYHFSQLPDMSLLSEQGPLRVRFEGKTHSLFEGMMQNISRESEEVRNQAAQLTERISEQQEAINTLSARVEAVLHNVEKRATDGDRGMKNILQSLTNSAKALKNAQTHSVDQLNRLIPHLQERAQGMAEIAQITGKQIAQTLQGLTLTEHSLKASAAQSEGAIKKLSSSADDVSTRLFGAVNLLQASGKVLAETTEKTQSRMSEVLEKLDHNASALLQGTSANVPVTAPNLNTSALESLVQAFEKAQHKLEENLSHQTQATQAHIDLLSSQSSSLLSQTSTTAQTLSFAADNLRDEQNRFEGLIDSIAAKLGAISTRLEEQATHQPSPVVSTAPSVNEDALHHLSEKMSQLADKIITMSNTTSTTSQLAALPHQIVSEINSRLDSTDQKLASLPVKLLEEIKVSSSITEKTLEELRLQIANLAEKNSSALEEPDFAERFNQRFNSTSELIEKLLADISSIKDIDADPSQRLVKEVESRWFQMAAQIEATRNDLAQAITQQIDRIEMRLIKSAPNAPAAVSTVTDNTQRQIEQQTQILTELVSTLGVLDAHMQQLKSEMRVAQR